MLSCRHRNTAAGSHRNVFIEDAQVVFVNKYHKGVEITSDVKIIHRYLAREIGELAVWYLSDRMKGLIYARDVVELGMAIQAIQREDSQIVTVMPTAAGKSMLFMLPAFVKPRGVTIVVVPLKGIRTDMIYRCEQLGIRWAAWEERASVDGASIVLVLPEKAVLPEFSTFIKRLKRLQSLDRIVIDESHIVLNGC
ncbi:hypothetical protein LTS12_021818 [Elasticomyces elasticus]|nr:hypothetical protein LTS12_021818 [Elasticomyces elasticus]